MLTKNFFSCTGMLVYNNVDSKTKAIAQVTVNNEFVINGIRVFEGANGPYALMPSKLVDGEYNSIIYPITAEARHELLDVVIRTYNNMVMSGMDRMPIVAAPQEPEKPSNIFVTLDKNHGRVKAIGKAVINNSLVITDIRVSSYIDENGEEKLFVGLPSFKTASNEYKDLVYITSPAFREKLNNTVMEVYQRILETDFMGLSYNDLRKCGEVTKIETHSKEFAKRFAEALDDVGVPYSARINSNSAIYVLKEDEDLATEVRKALSRRLIQSAA